MGPVLTLNFEQVQMVNPARGRYLLGVYGREESDQRFAHYRRGDDVLYGEDAHTAAEGNDPRLDRTRILVSSDGRVLVGNGHVLWR